MTKSVDEHALSVEEKKLSPVVIIVTGFIILLFIFAIFYRIVGTLI